MAFASKSFADFSRSTNLERTWMSRCPMRGWDGIGGFTVRVRLQPQQHRRRRVLIVASSSTSGGPSGGRDSRTSVPGSRTTSRGARERRHHRQAEEKRRRAEEAQRKYPEWASILEDAIKDDTELREIIGDSVGNPDEMRRRVEERVRRKGQDILSPKTGSAVAMTVTFKADFDPLDTYIWLELYAEPSHGDVDTIGNSEAVVRARQASRPILAVTWFNKQVITSWYMLGKLGAFNSMNMQLTSLPIDAKLRYSTEQAVEALPSMFHNITDLEFQDNWGRFWVDLGTSDPVAMDVLVNALSAVSSDHVGIKQLVFGGQKLGDWAEGLDDPQDGYKCFKI